MNALTPQFGSPQDLILKSESLVGILERLCEIIEPTDTQYDTAGSRYKTIGGWIAGASNHLLSGADMYVQGSFAIRTATRPLTDSEYDVDLVCHLPNIGYRLEPWVIKRELGQRLKEHGTYASMLEEMPRCWRINYANEFHLDITPSVPNHDCSMGGELVPDKALQQWKPSNPKGYRDRFEARARFQPRILGLQAFDEAPKAGTVAPFPKQTRFKSILHRIVQLAKRHRDIHCNERDPGLRPISVIITTLAARSYELCLHRSAYNNELEVLRDVIVNMLNFIICNVSGGYKNWYIENESTKGENFAEKWNSHPERADAFFVWHARLIEDIDRLIQAAGLDVMRKSLGDTFGKRLADQAFDEMTTGISSARHAGTLKIAPAVGLSTAAKAGTTVRTNTFFGRG